MPTYPDDLTSPRSRAELATIGVGWREQAGPLWRSPYRDVHVWSATDANPGQRAREAAALLPPEGAVGGWAAAQIGSPGCDLDGLGPAGTDVEPVLLCLPPRLRVRRDSSIRTLRSRLDPDDVVEVDGVRITSPTRTAFDLARRAIDLCSAVVAVDVTARGHPGFLANLADYARERPGWGGVRRVLRSVALASERSLSTGETRMRFVWRVEAGLPQPLVNASILDRHGNLLGLVDLLDPRSGIVGEYDGAVHAGSEQRSRDRAREHLLLQHGLCVVRATATDLRQERLRLRRLLRSSHEAAGLRAKTAEPDWFATELPMPWSTPHW